jgi:hypothetical protein
MARMDCALLILSVATLAVGTGVTEAPAGARPCAHVLTLYLHHAPSSCVCIGLCTARTWVPRSEPITKSLEGKLKRSKFGNHGGHLVTCFTSTTLHSNQLSRANSRPVLLCEPAHVCQLHPKEFF